MLSRNRHPERESDTAMTTASAFHTIPLVPNNTAFAFVCSEVDQLIIDDCPYCHCRHVHGRGDSDPARPTWVPTGDNGWCMSHGPRVPHCEKPPVRDYWLV